MLRRTALLLTALLAATACGPSSAQSLVNVDVIDRDTGEWLPEYHHRGQEWVPGAPGHHYSVRLTNTTGERVLVVLSVDGVNAISGETAGAGQAGYVLGPWQSTEVAGWRKSMQDVAQFYFTDLPDSYAARTGRPDNVGVIGVAVFRERVYSRPEYVPMPEEYRRYGNREEAAQDKSAAPAAPAADSAARAGGYAAEREQRLGTGHGEREWSPVSRTEFVRASRAPAQLSHIRYDETRALVAMGVIPRPYDRWQRRRHDGPDAFPGGFAADPPPRW